jgi:radical SAM protein with 4Fe4S-binding SPASM domain
MKFRYLNYRFKYKYAKYLNLSKPIDVCLELSSICNQQCSYCYHGDQKTLPFKQALMPLSIAKKSIIEAAEIGTNSIKFNFRGESTLHPDFLLITSFAKKLSSKSTFIDRLTNSNFKFKNDNDDIFNALCNQTKVKISFDSFLPNVMETQRAGSNKDLAIANIDKFYNFKNRRSTSIVIQAVRTNLNKDEDIKQEVKRRWPEAYVSINDMVVGRTSKNLRYLKVKDLDNNRQSCIQAHSRLIINWDGRVTVCCPDIGSKLIIGDIYHENILDIWNSPTAKSIRNDLLNGSAFKFEPCSSCPSFESYKGFNAKWDS